MKAESRRGDSGQEEKGKEREGEKKRVKMNLPITIRAVGSPWRADYITRGTPPHYQSLSFYGYRHFRLLVLS